MEARYQTAPRPDAKREDTEVRTERPSRPAGPVKSGSARRRYQTAPRPDAKREYTGADANLGLLACYIRESQHWRSPSQNDRFIPPDRRNGKTPMKLTTLTGCALAGALVAASLFGCEVNPPSFDHRGPRPVGATSCGSRQLQPARRDSRQSQSVLNSHGHPDEYEQPARRWPSDNQLKHHNDR